MHGGKVHTVCQLLVTCQPSATLVPPTEMKQSRATLGAHVELGRCLDGVGRSVDDDPRRGRTGKAMLRVLGLVGVEDALLAVRRAGLLGCNVPPLVTGGYAPPVAMKVWSARSNLAQTEARHPCSGARIAPSGFVRDC